MSIAFVQSRSVDLGSVTSGSLAFNSNVTAGSLIIVAIRVSVVGRTITVIDAQGNTYAQAFATLNDGQGDDMACYYAMNAVGGTTDSVTVSISLGATSIRIAIHEYSGIATTGALDQATRQVYSANSTPNSGNVTTTQAAELLFGFVENGGSSAASFTAGASYNKREQLVIGGILKIGTEDQIISSTGVYSAGVTLNVADSGGMGIATFKGAGAGASRGLFMPPNLTTGGGGSFFPNPVT